MKIILDFLLEALKVIAAVIIVVVGVAAFLVIMVLSIVLGIFVAIAYLIVVLCAFCLASIVEWWQKQFKKPVHKEREDFDEWSAKQHSNKEMWNVDPQGMKEKEKK